MGLVRGSRQFFRPAVQWHEHDKGFVDFNMPVQLINRYRYAIGAHEKFHLFIATISRNRPCYSEVLRDISKLGVMKLADIVTGLETADDSLCIVAKRPWAGDSEAKLVRFSEDFRIPEEAQSAGYEYFLEVTVARDEVFSGPVALSDDQKISAVIYYAENDAFPEWLNALAQQ